MYLLTVSLTLFSLGVSQTPDNGILKGDRSDRSLFYLEVAFDMITKAKLHYPLITLKKTSSPMDCTDVLRNGYNESGVYTIWPKSRLTDDRPLEVFCDMETDGGGWTVFQRRGDFNRSNDYFFQDWANYKSGFGDIRKDFWMGNDNVFALTNQRPYSIRIDLQDMKGEKRYAVYDTFWIDDESYKYTLHIKDYSGDAGDSLTQHNKLKFTTKDQDNDASKNRNCAQEYKGAWWFNACHFSNLNGPYLRGKQEIKGDGIIWNPWKGNNESLKTTEMKIRPKKFQADPIVLNTPGTF